MLAPAVADRLVPIAPLGQAGVDAVLVRVDGRPRHDSGQYQRLDGLLLDVLQHPDRHLAVAPGIPRTGGFSFSSVPRPRAPFRRRRVLCGPLLENKAGPSAATAGSFPCPHEAADTVIQVKRHVRAGSKFFPDLRTPKATCRSLRIMAPMMSLAGLPERAKRSLSTPAAAGGGPRKSCRSGRQSGGGRPCSGISDAAAGPCGSVLPRPLGRGAVLAAHPLGLAPAAHFLITFGIVEKAFKVEHRGTFPGHNGPLSYRMPASLREIRQPSKTHKEPEPITMQVIA